MGEGVTLYKVCIHLYNKHLQGEGYLEILIHCPSCYFIPPRCPLSPVTNNMLHSIHHTACAHVLSIKLIILSGRAIIILLQDPSPSSFHQEPDPVNNPCCRQQDSRPIRPTRVGPKYPGVCNSCRAPFVSATREEGYEAGQQYLRPRVRAEGKSPGTVGDRVFDNVPSRGVWFWDDNDSQMKNESWVSKQINKQQKYSRNHKRKHGY